MTHILMVFSLSSRWLTATSSALLGNATDNVIYAQEHDCTLNRCLDGLHLRRLEVSEQQGGSHTHP